MIGYSSEGAFDTGDNGPQMFSAPKTIHGPMLAQVQGKWVQVPAFVAYGQKTVGGGEGEGTQTTVYLDQKGQPLTDPMQDPKYGGGVGGTNFFEQNADGTPGALIGSVSNGHASFGGQALEKAMPYLALSALGGFAAAGAGAAGAAGSGALGAGQAELGVGALGDAGASGIAGGAAGGIDGALSSGFNSGVTAANQSGLAQLASNAGTVDAGLGGVGTGALAPDAADAALATFNAAVPSTAIDSAVAAGMPTSFQSLAAASAAAGAGGAGGAATGAAGAIQRIISGSGTMADYASLALPLAGGLLGSQSGAQQAGTTTTVNDIPDWQKPYVLDLFNKAQQTYNQSQANQTQNQNLVNAGGQQLQDTINGKYLSPDSNPYLKGMFNAGADQITNKVNSQFESSGRYGSGAQTGELGYQLNNLASTMYGNAYQQGRQQQLTAATAAPGYAQSAAQNPFAALDSYSNIIRSPLGGTQSTPYYNNPTGGALSGALAGYGLSKAFG